MTNLKLLHLSENLLSTLPAEIGKMTNLTALYLENNQLSSLPKDISRLKNLQKFVLTGNQLPNAEEILGRTDAPAEIIQAFLNYLKEDKPLRVFLCHSSGDKPMVRELYKRLSQDGIQP